MSGKLRFIVLGIMGRTPVAGVAWQALHYLDGLRRLGHEVNYVEDTQTWPYNSETATNDCAHILQYLSRLMTWCGLKDRWAFCDVSQEGRVHGVSEFRLSQIIEQADAVINLTGSTELRDNYLQVPVRVYLETDPGVPQIAVAQGDRYTIDFMSDHTHHFSYAENFGKEGCRLPVGPFKYHPTRQPVILDWWPAVDGAEPNVTANCSGRRAFTTIASWQQSNDIIWNGETYTWSKDRQFLKFIDLPVRSRQAFELALACDDLSATALLESHGWQVLDAVPLTRDIFPYRDYITGSRGEFTVAKDQYVRLGTGWFSDRSACYLAAGRPVVTQDTGFGKFLPTGAGLYAFNTIDEILAAFEAINFDYEKHSRAARAIAEEYFNAETVLARLIEDLGL